MSGSVAREFVDANVLVYAFDSSAGRKRDIAAQLLERLWDNESGRLSVHVLQEFFVTITRKVAHPLSTADAEDRIRELVAWPVFAPTADDVLQAIVVARKMKVSFWDAMILHAAAESGCEVCWTEDLNAGQRWRDVQIRDPFALTP